MPKKLTQEEFIKKCKLKYGNKYDYSKVNYINYNTKITIICHQKDKFGNEHGEFSIRPSDFLNGHSCRKCKGNYQYKNINEFVKFYYNLYPDRKHYIEIPLKQNYVNNKTKIKVICHQKDKNRDNHGEFLIRPNDLITGYCCPKCGNSIRKTTEQFINEAQEIHGNKYDYSKVNYINAYTKVIIICPEHGEFKQIAANHLNGSNCPLCNVSVKSYMEEEICKQLTTANYVFEQQKTFEWLKFNKNLFLDFYIPEYNIAIECQGEQHFKSISIWGGDEELYLRQQRDKIKKDLCDKHNIKLFYITKNNLNINEINNYIDETTN